MTVPNWVPVIVNVPLEPELGLTDVTLGERDVSYVNVTAETTVLSPSLEDKSFFRIYFIDCIFRFDYSLLTQL